MLVYTLKYTFVCTYIHVYVHIHCTFVKHPTDSHELRKNLANCQTSSICINIFVYIYIFIYTFMYTYACTHTYTCIVWRTCKKCLIFIVPFPQNSSITNGSFAERVLYLETSYASPDAVSLQVFCCAGAL